MPQIAEHIAECLDHGGFARARNTGEANAQRLARPRQKPLEHALGELKVAAAVALDERNRTREGHAVAAFHACDVVILGKNELAARHPRSIQQFRIDIADRQVLDPLDAAHNTRREFAVRILGHPVGSLCCIFFAHDSSFPMAKRRPRV